MVCTLGYQTGIQIYDQISITRIWSKVKLHHAVLLRFVLNEGKIALNITIFGMHSYLPNGHLNLLSNFNSKKLVKSETSSCALTKVALKGSENGLEHHESWRAPLYIKPASKSMIENQF